MKTLVVEDSRLARKGLIRMLTQHNEVELIGEAQNVSDALILIERHQPELIFLDIHMPEASGFDLLNQLDHQPKVIFTTAYAEYAIQSFEYDTVDYLLKPISKSRLASAIDKLTKQSPANNDPVSDPALTLDSQILLHADDTCHLVKLKQISLIESCKNYVQVFWNTDETSPNQHSEFTAGTHKTKSPHYHKAFIKKSLSQIEARLPQSDFFRANRQFIINLHNVTHIEPSAADGYHLSLEHGRLIDVSRRNAAKLKELLSL